jgi:hypothetical protein
MKKRAKRVAVGPADGSCRAAGSPNVRTRTGSPIITSPRARSARATQSPIERVARMIQELRAKESAPRIESFMLC